MPYVSKAELQAEQERAKWVGLSELVRIVQAESNCSVETAHQQIRNALADGAIWPLRWESEPPESAYCHRQRGSGVRFPSWSELMGLGEPGCPPPSEGRRGWADYRSVLHWQAVEIDWEQERVLDDFERNAFPQMRKDYRSADLGPDRPPRPRKAEWRTLWLDREACDRLWPPVPHVTGPISPTRSKADAVASDVQRLQSDGLSNKSAAASGCMMPKYHLVSDPLNDIMQEDGGFYRMGFLRLLIEEEWHNGNIELLRDGGDPKAEVLEPLHRKIFLERPGSGERWVKCYIVINGRHETPYILDEDLQYVLEKAAAQGIDSIDESDNTKIQPIQPNRCALQPQRSPPLPNSQHTISQETKCHAWLCSLMKNATSPVKSKTAYQREAVKRYGVSVRGFNRAWGSAITGTGNENWKKPGRKSKRCPGEKS